MDVNRVKRATWRKIATRQNALLFWSIGQGGHRYFKEVTGLAWKQTHIICFPDGNFYYDERELEKLERLLKKRGYPALKQFRDRLITHVNNHDVVAGRIGKRDFKDVSQSSLRKELVAFGSSAERAFNFLASIRVIEGVITHNILSRLPAGSDEDKREWLRVLTYPERENESTKELRSFYGLVRHYVTKGRRFESMLRRHLEEYAWLGARLYRFQCAWQHRDVIDRIQEFVSSKKDVGEEIRALNALRRKGKREALALISRLGIKRGSELDTFIRLARELVFLRTWRTDMIYRGGYRARSLLYEIARRAGFPEEDVIFLTLKEVQTMAKSKRLPISKAEVKRRKSGAVIMLQGGKVNVFTQKRLHNTLKHIVESPVRSTKLICGQATYPGVVRGRARVVHSTEDLHKVTKGDVLVAVMTFAQFVPAMEKAGAFVTDEGGILCHAAIVSREFKKPCIIGTKIATQVLKDGDKVEVDANKGVVKIITPQK